MKYKLEIQDTEVLYKGFFTLRKFTLSHSLFAGGMCPPIHREIISRGNAVAILLYDAMRDSVVLIEQFRIGAMEDEHGAWVIELVAGFQEQGESVEDVVRREVMEEAGCTIGHIETISDFYINPANTSDRIILVCAQVDSSQADGIHGIREEGEDIRVHVMSSESFFSYFDSGRALSATPLVALQWLKLNRTRLSSLWMNQE